MIKGTLLCELWKLFEFKKDKANITTPIFIMKNKKKKKLLLIKYLLIARKSWPPLQKPLVEIQT